MPGKSSRPRLRQVRDVFRLLGEMQELGHDAIAWQRRMIEGLCDLVGARQGASLQFAEFTADGQIELRSLIPAGWSVPAAAEHWEQWLKKGHYREDPILDGLTELEARVVTRIRQQVVEDDTWHRSPLAQTVAVVADIDPHLVGFYRKRRRDEIHGISLYRGHGDPQFNLRERNIVHIFNVELRRLYRAGELSLAEAPRLSPRERQVLDLLLRGEGEKQVAAALGLSRYTVNDYVKSLYRKHDVSSRGELLARFIRKGKTVATKDDGKNGDRGD